jgi:Rod binding domain-containing protein
MEIGLAIDPLLTLQAARKPPEPKPGGGAEALRRAAEEFEAFFAGQMLEQMFKGLSTDGPFGGGNGERIWRSFMIEEYGELIAKSGGLGIADAVYRELLTAQEGR